MSSSAAGGSSSYSGSSDSSQESRVGDQFAMEKEDKMSPTGELVTDTSQSSSSDNVVDLTTGNLYETNVALKRKFNDAIKSGTSKKPKKPKISSAVAPYPKYFEDINTDDTGKPNPSVRCIVVVASPSVDGKQEICGEILTYFAGVTYNNLKLHLARKHGITLENSLKSSQRTPSISEFKDMKTKYPNTNSKQQTFDRNILRMYALDGCPFNSVERKGFQNVILGLDPRINIKSRQTYVEQLRKLVIQEVVPSMKKRLQDIEKRFCHFSCDIWSTRAMEGVMCILAHFIDDNWSLQQRVLLFESVNEQHTGVAIRGIFLKCLANYQVPADWGGVVVSDNAANMKNSFNLMNIGMDDEWKHMFAGIDNRNCEAENEAGANSNDMEDIQCSPLELESEGIEEIQDVDCNRNVEIEDCEEAECIDFANRVVQQFADEMYKSTLNLPIAGHLFCAAHSLQLGINNALSKDTVVKSFILLVNKVMVFFKTSTLWRTELKKETKYEPVLAGKTRWNSTLDMLNRFRQPEFFRAARNVIDRAMLDRSTSAGRRARIPPALGVLHLEQADELYNVLHSMGVATDALQSDGPTSNEIVLRVVLAYRDLLNVKTTVFETFRLDLLGNLKTRMQPYIQKKEYVIAGILDPRLKASLFQLTWNTPKELELEIPDRAEAVGYLHEIYAQEISVADSSQQKKNKSALVPTGVFSIVQEALQMNQNPDKTEIEFYLEELASDQSACPLEYWKANSKRFPILGRIARKYLAIPATSAGVERIFSVSGAIARSRRSKISTKRIAELLMLRNSVT